MVKATGKYFWRDERGIALTETLLILPVVLIIITAMVEGGVAVFQWNQATKSVQIGARLAAVSSPIVGDIAYADLSNDWSTVPGGDPVPAGTISVSCGPGSAPCDADRINRLLQGSDSSCDASLASPGDIMGMCDFASFIGVDNVHVTYYRSGLGYVGRPDGPVSTITVGLRNLTFDFLIFDKLIPILGTINIPSLPVSFVSEDVNDCKETCP